MLIMCLYVVAKILCVKILNFEKFQHESILIWLRNSIKMKVLNKIYHEFHCSLWTYCTPNIYFKTVSFINSHSFNPSFWFSHTISFYMMSLTSRFVSINPKVIITIPMQFWKIKALRFMPGIEKRSILCFSLP